MAKTQHYLTLDGMRGVAAFIVVLVHVAGMTTTGIRDTSAPLAVDLFFCLSGFVLAHAYERKLAAGMTVKSFMAARLIRLGPLFILGHIIGLLAFGRIALPGNALQAEGRGALWGAFSFTGLPTPSISSAATLYPLDMPAWSLFFEIVINFAFAVYLARGRRLSPKVLLIAFATFLVVCCWAHGQLDGGYQWSSAYVGFARVCYSFGTGVALYHIKDRDWAKRIKLPAPVLYLGLAALLLLPIPASVRLAYDLALVLAVFPALVLSGASSGSLGWFAKGEKQVGRASYAIYITHFPLSMIYAAAVAKMFHRSAESLAPFSGLAFLPLIFFAALVFDRFMDTPIRRAIDRRRRGNHETVRQKIAAR
jgi:peptidoglycan/LPS O-acetylase OafA/YrhL